VGFGDEGVFGQEKKQFFRLRQDDRRSCAMTKTGESPDVGKASTQAADVEQKVGKDARTWAMWCHLAGLAWLLWWIVPVIGGVVGPLVVWQAKRDDYPFVDEQGKEALNFQISMLIYWIISGFLCLGCIGFVLVPMVTIADVILAIVASIKAGNGESYRYPLNLRLVK
jgi:uncharacterized Tic20 family protein